MGRVNDAVNTVNSSVRTLLMVVALAGATFAGWKGYSLYNEPQKKLAEQQQKLDEVADLLAAAESQLLQRKAEINKLTADLQEKAAEVARLETSVRLLKLRHRIAHIRVLEQQRVSAANESADADDQEGDAQAERMLTTVEFVEVNSEGEPIDDRRRIFQIEGEQVYVDCLVAKFDDAYVEQADLDRGTAICLIQRIYGENQEPSDGYEIDQQGTRPTSYARGGQMSPFEQKIWADFWTLANDPAKAADIGIRAAHGVAPSMKVTAGSVYELELRATGEFSLKPIQSGATEPPEP